MKYKRRRLTPRRRTKMMRWHRNAFPFPKAFFIGVGLLLALLSIGIAHAERQPTGNGGKLSFSTGMPVLGAFIQLDDGRSDEQCYTASAPTSGVVTSGVVFPFPQEAAQMSRCQFDKEITPAGSTNRQPTGDGGSLSFPVGAQAVGGYFLLDDGSEAFGPCVVTSASNSGMVTSGVISPNPGELSAPECVFKQKPQYTGVGNIVAFTAGTPIAGAAIRLSNGTLYQQCFMDPAPLDGKVTTGALFPAEGDLANLSPCDLEHPVLWRMPTGDGKTLQFKGGVSVFGYLIILADGRRWNNCAIVAPPADGWITSGVIFPFEQELQQQKTCDMAHPDAQRTETGSGRELTFIKGTPVLGAFIQLNQSGAQFKSTCWMPSAPEDGKVNSGVLWPKPDEVVNIPICR